MPNFPKPKKWFPKNTQKYIGNVNNIISRSSWETKFLNWCDTTPGVVKYNSEELVVPYMSPVDGLQHRYFVDFMIMVKTRQGEIKKYAVEIKPEAQTVPPKPNRNKVRYLNESATYAINQAKWEAASRFCNKMGVEFIVLTEKHLKV
jgi:hypothetical protein